MMAAGELLPFWQELIQVAPPPCRVLATTQPLCLSRVKHALDTPANPRARFRLALQSGFKIERTSSVVTLSTGSRRKGAAYSEGHFPLGGMLLVAPGRPHSLDQPVSTFPEGSALSASWRLLD